MLKMAARWPPFMHLSYCHCSTGRPDELLRFNHGNFVFAHFVEITIVDIMLGFASDKARKREHHDDIRNGHERIADIGNEPDGIANAHGAQKPMIT